MNKHLKKVDKKLFGWIVEKEYIAQRVRQYTTSERYFDPLKPLKLELRVHKLDLKIAKCLLKLSTVKEFYVSTPDFLCNKLYNELFFRKQIYIPKTVSELY